MPTNRGVRIHRFGGPEVLELEDLPMPQPQDDEVVVRVHAASINPVDYKTRGGGYPDGEAGKPPRPTRPGPVRHDRGLRPKRPNAEAGRPGLCHGWTGSRRLRPVRHGQSRPKWPPSRSG